jgi:trk system potassium uptake protein TrkA
MQGSILTTLLLKELKVRKRICRALDAGHATVLGKDLVILPTRDMVYRLAKRLRDNLGSDRQQLCGDQQLAQIRSGSTLHSKSLRETRLRERYHANLILITRLDSKGETVSCESTPDQITNLGEMLFVAGKRENLNQFERDKQRS